MQSFLPEMQVPGTLGVWYARVFFRHVLGVQLMSLNTVCVKDVKLIPI